MNGPCSNTIFESKYIAVVSTLFVEKPQTTDYPGNQSLKTPRVPSELLQEGLGVTSEIRRSATTFNVAHFRAPTNRK